MKKARSKPNPDTDPLNVRIVGIGASAGGLEALRELMESLPDSDVLTYVIAQHVSPTHVSMLMNLLAPLTSLKVQDLVDKQSPEPGNVYITPPNSDVVLDKGLFRLTEPHQAIGPKPSVNHFFHSLAEELGEQAIGIILSGTGSDGASGIRAIKASGGITLVQEPDTAKYDGMPKAAIHTGSVDLIMPPGKMGPALERLLSQPRDIHFVLNEAEETDEYTQISNIVRVNTAFKLSDYKSGTVRRRIARRMNIVGTGTLGEYIEYLKANKEESLLLMRDTFISVTSFFRDQDAYFALERVIGEIVKARSDRDVIRCWVPACASGEEVYSIAMLFEEALRNQNKTGLQYMIFASDLDDDAIERARAALYPISELEAVPKILRDLYMEVVGDHCRVIKSIRNRVVFARQNVIEDPPFARLDLISCRNLLIYFKPPVQKRVFEVFHYSLNPGGYLFLGKSETVDQQTALFKPVDNRVRIYQRQEGVSHYALPVTQGVLRAQPGRPEPGRNATASTDLISMRTLEELTERYAPPSLVISAEDNVVHFQGDLKAFLSFPKGRADMYLFDLVNSSLRAELRALVYRCRRDLQVVQGSAWPMEIDGKPRIVTPAVSPLEPGQASLLLVSFQVSRQEEDKVSTTRLQTDERDNLIISELEQELANTRTHLNVVVEELETSNEELQSLNEELQSTNEELQSTNEELQTSNEELQSTNEELLTVNEEMQVKSAELETTASDLINVKQSLAFPLIVVDSNLRITQVNDACGAIIALDSPLERSSLSSVQWLVDVPGLSNQVRRVVKDGKQYRAVVSSAEEASYQLHVMPYRIAKNEIAGAVLLFEDITSQQRVEAALRESEERYELAVRGSSDGLWDWKIPTNQIYYTPRFKAILGYHDDEMENTFEAWESRMHPDDRTRTLAALEAHLKDDTPYDVEYRLHRKAGDYVWVRSRGQAVRNKGEAVRMAGSISNINQQKLAELALRENEVRLRLMTANIKDYAIFMLDLDGRVYTWNEGAQRLEGYEWREIIGQPMARFHTPQDIAIGKPAALLEQAKAEGRVKDEGWRVRKDGTRFYAEVIITAMLNEAGDLVGYTKITRDITERKEADDELRLAANVFSNTLDGICIADLDGTIIKVNHAFERITGYSTAEVVGQNPRILRSDRHSAEFYADLWKGLIEQGSWQGEIWDRHKNGHVFPVWLSISSMHDEAGNVDRYIANMYDITEQKLTQERINYLAHYDGLTGLPNRTLFMDRLGHALAQARRQEKPLALLFIDLDNFKQVNDTRGHPVGDELLTQVAGRLQGATREGDTLARLSGDEFTLLIENTPDLNGVQATAQKILALLAKPFELSDGQVFISASIGIAVFPDDGADCDALLKNADLAMYRSKEKGRNQYHLFTQEMSDVLAERMALHSALHLALDQQGLELHYQPIMAVDTRRCVGAEALARWQHPKLGWVPPNKFIALAEENSLIFPLGEWALREACRQMKAWLDAGLTLDTLAVNVSGKQITHGDFTSMARRILEETGCPPERIVLELTESFIMRESEGAIAALNQLRNLGFGIAIDDFGTGYSSLSYLKRLPVTKLKLDQSFVRDIPDDKNDAAIARAILGLGRALGLDVVAEGVETEAQHEFIRAEACALSQGYLYSQALTPAAFTEFFSGHGTLAANSR